MWFCLLNEFQSKSIDLENKIAQITLVSQGKVSIELKETNAVFIIH